MMACRVVAVSGAAIAFLGAVDAAGATAPVNLTVRQVETLWAVP
jgi:hypothetical protein